MEKTTRAASFFTSQIPSSHLPQVSASSFPSTHAFRFKIFDAYWIWITVWISLSAFSDVLDLNYWNCSHFRFLSSLTLFPPCFFRFSSMLLASLVGNICILWYRTDFIQVLEAVISSEEGSGEIIVLRLLNEPSAKIGNTFWELVIEVEGTKPETYLDMLL